MGQSALRLLLICDTMCNEKSEQLSEYLSSLGKAALAFSGGTDSYFLLWACRQSGMDVKPYFVKGAFQTQEESVHAVAAASALGMDLSVLEVDTLSFEEVVENSADRCYLCKRRVFSLILERACSDGYDIVMDATNASDDPSVRPGMRALTELGIRSPLRECDITKPELRELSKAAGLDNWDTPSNSCLATRIPTGTRITAEDLQKVEYVESRLKIFGLRDFRLRSFGDRARLETVPGEESFVEENRSEIEMIVLSRYRQIEFGTRVPGLRCFVNRLS